jgi:hypothetical protein
MSNVLKFSSFLLLIFLAAGCHKKKKTNSFHYSPQNPSAAVPKGLKNSKSDFVANLSKGNESSKPSQTAATGQVLFKVSGDHSQIYYTINLNQIDSVTVVQLRYGAHGKKGNFIGRLYPRLGNGNTSAKGAAVNGTLTSGMLNSKDLRGHFQDKKIKNLIDAINHDSISIQVDTKKHPRGAINGFLKQPKKD